MDKDKIAKNKHSLGEMVANLSPLATSIILKDARYIMKRYFKQTGNIINVDDAVRKALNGYTKV